MFWILLLLSMVVMASVLENDRTYIFLVTDPHGVYSGHPHQPQFSADYPALSSFVDSLRDQASKLKNCFVYFFENGDLVDGQSSFAQLLMK
ncbi:hypothetical protein BASA81_002722 [Batrachochytrium salamandrivorans]|nr:hypothetical protein BASA81_002722 [Batrachochytrium salamandrivorans]